MNQIWIPQNLLSIPAQQFPLCPNPFYQFSLYKSPDTWSTTSHPLPTTTNQYMHRTVIVIQQGGVKLLESSEDTQKQTYDNKNQCPHCKKCFKFRIQYFRHLSDRYKHCQQKFGDQFIPDRVAKKPKVYACKQCLRSYTQKSALRRHKKNKKHR